MESRVSSGLSSIIYFYPANYQVYFHRIQLCIGNCIFSEIDSGHRCRNLLTNLIYVININLRAADSLICLKLISCNSSHCMRYYSSVQLDIIGVSGWPVFILDRVELFHIRFIKSTGFICPIQTLISFELCHALTSMRFEMYHLAKV